MCLIQANNYIITIQKVPIRKFPISGLLSDVDKATPLTLRKYSSKGVHPPVYPIPYCSVLQKCTEGALLKWDIALNKAYQTLQEIKEERREFFTTNLLVQPSIIRAIPGRPSTMYCNKICTRWFHKGKYPCAWPNLGSRKGTSERIHHLPDKRL